MKKKILALAMSAIMMVGLVGCTTVTPEQLLLGSVDTFKDAESGRVILDGMFEVSGDESFGGSGSIDMKFIEEGEQFVSNVDAEVQGIGVKMYTELREDTLISNVPVALPSTKYVRISKEDLQEQMGEDVNIDEQEDKLREIDFIAKKQAFLSSLKEHGHDINDLMGLNPEVTKETIKVDEKDMNTKVITMNIKTEKLVVLMEEAMRFINQDEELLTAFDVEKLSDEELESEITSMKEEYELSKDYVTFNAFEIKMYFGKSNKLVRESFNLDMLTKSDYEGESDTKFKMNANVTFLDINNVTELEFKDIAEEDLVTPEEAVMSIFEAMY